MNKKMITLVGVGVAGAALTLSGTSATAGDFAAATGGGQTMVGDSGAGDTIAFTARETADGARGQVQYVDRSDDGSQTVRHGSVVCIDVQENVAKIAGTWRDGGGSFNLYVRDNGQGAAADDDVVAITMGDPMCDFDDPDEDPNNALARGNAQVRPAG